MTNQPTLFDLPAPEPIPTETLMRRLGELENERDRLERTQALTGQTPPQAASVIQSIENVKAELRNRGHEL